MAEVMLRDGGTLYYESHGHGEPVVFLNGIMMNTVSWTDFIPVLAKHFRLILVDFRDQGRSSKLSAGYTIDQHAQDLVELLDHLELPGAHIMGLSYGGQVALRLALEKASRARITTLLLFNVVCSLSNHLRAIGAAWSRAAKLHDGEAFFDLAIPFIYSARFYETSLDYLKDRQKLFKKALTDEWFESLDRLQQSVERYEVPLEQLASIDIPTLLVGGQEDIIAPPKHLEAMHEKLPQSELLLIAQAGHGAVLERMEEFLTLVIGFVAKHSAR